MIPESLKRAVESSAMFREIFSRLALFPLCPILSGPACACPRGAECARIGKHPAVRWNERELGPGAKIVGAAGCGYGIATGHRSGLCILDIDSDDANDHLNELGDIPSTFTVASARGWHVYLTLPDFPVRKSLSELARGVDVLGEGAYAVAPGSPHKTGVFYEVVDDRPLASAPAWLLEWPGLRKREGRAATGPGAIEVEATLAAVPKAWRIARARGWLATRPPAIQGQGGDRVTWLTLLTAVKSSCLTDAAMVEEAFSDWNARCEPPWNGAQWIYNVERAIQSSAVPWATGLELAYWCEQDMARNLARVAS